MDVDTIANEAVTAHKAMQKPEELADFMRWLLDHRVRSILEIGCAYGGTLWAWSQLGLEVHGIDLPTYSGNDIRAAARRAGARLQVGSSQDAYVLAHAPYVDVVFIDGEHSFNGVTLDFLNYSPRASIAVAIHDIFRHYQAPDCEVDKAWAVIKARSSKCTEILHPPKHWGGIGIWEP